MDLAVLSSITQTIDYDSPFGVILSYLALFFFGGFIGYIVEVLFRRFVSMKRWINPGFLKGPCIPLYGFGLCVLYFFSNLGVTYLQDPNDISDFYKGMATPQGSLPFWATSIIVILLIGVTLTLVEYIGGIIFIKLLHIRLWDYSNLKGNIEGIICPLFSAIWLVGGAVYWFCLAPFINELLVLLANHLWGYTFILGGCFFILIVDFTNSLIVSFKLSGKAKELKMVVDFEKFKLNSKHSGYKYYKTPDFIEELSSAATPVKEKIKEVATSLKAKMYVNNEIPETKNMSETPRTKVAEEDDGQTIDN